MAPFLVNNNRGNTIIEATFSSLILQVILVGFFYFIAVTVSQQVTLINMDKALVKILEGQTTSVQQKIFKIEVSHWAPWVRIQYFQLRQNVDRDNRLSVEGKLSWCIYSVCRYTKNTLHRKLSEKRIADLRL